MTHEIIFKGLIWWLIFHGTDRIINQLNFGIIMARFKSGNQHIALVNSD